MAEDLSGEVALGLAAAFLDPERKWSVATRQFARVLIRELAKQHIVVRREVMMASSMRKLTFTSEDMDLLLGYHVLHVERVPSTSGPGAYHWTVTVEKLTIADDDVPTVPPPPPSEPPAAQ